MNKLSLSLLLACSTLFCANCVAAQDSKESHTASVTESHTESDAHSDSSASGTKPYYADQDAHFFRLVFVIEEKDGARVVDRREYKLDTDSQDGRGTNLRSGDRVPVMKTEKGERQSEYMDMGVSLRVDSAVLLGDAVAMRVSAQVRRMPQDSAAGTTENIFRNQEWDSRVFAALNKPTLIFSSDDPNSTHTFTVSLTPTLLR